MYTYNRASPPLLAPSALPPRRKFFSRAKTKWTSLVHSTPPARFQIRHISTLSTHRFLPPL
jgi:hypothetical protein